MPDIAKTISGLNAIRETLLDMRDWQGIEWIDNAVSLLKEKEQSKEVFDRANLPPVKPNEIRRGKTIMYYQCPQCLGIINSGETFCSCGRPVKWEEEPT